MFAGDPLIFTCHVSWCLCHPCSDMLAGLVAFYCRTDEVAWITDDECSFPFLGNYGDPGIEKL